MRPTQYVCAATAVALLGIGPTVTASGAPSMTACDPRAKAEEAVTLATKPAPPVAGQNEFSVTVRDGNCEPIVGATVSIELVMPAMPGMPEMRSKVALAAAADPQDAAAGIYTGRGQIFMAGRWNVTIAATVDGTRVAGRTLALRAR